MKSRVIEMKIVTDKMSWLSIASFLCLLVVGSGVIISALPIAERLNHQETKHVFSQSYVAHDNIFITGNEEFLTQAALEGWPGNGSASNPIVISGYSFYHTPTQPVRIWKTDLHWMFTNNLVETDGSMCGFYLVQTTAGIVSNNVFHSCHSAIVIVNCENMLIENNTCLDNTGNGINQDGGFSNAIIRYNEFVGHGADAIGLEDPDNVEIYGNYINGARYDGVDIRSAHDILIENNTILGTRVGIRMDRHTTDVQVEGNLIRTVSQDGINSDADSTLIQNNILRDIGRHGIIFSGSESYAESSQVYNNILINCTEYAIQIDPGVVDTTIASNDFYETARECHICDNSTGAVISGNFYDTWSFPDADGNGFVDTPYALAGAAENSDPTPRVSPATPVPDDYDYIPMTPTPAISGLGDLTIDGIALIAGVSIVICIIVVMVVKKR